MHTNIALVSPARNEGPFLLEWLAWHRALGFEDILVLTHDCTDGSDRMLDRLAAHGLVRHTRHTPNKGMPPLRSAYRAARLDQGVQAADLVMALDTDEYLNVFVGAGTIHDLVALNMGEALGMAVYWKVFGSSGVKVWQDIFVREQFTRAAPEQHRANASFKSIFRHLEMFKVIASHSPRGFIGTWGGQNIWVDANGTPLKAIRLTRPAKHSRATHTERITHAAAQVNHYAVKSTEGFALKSTQRSGALGVFRHNAEFLEFYDRNETGDHAAIASTSAFEAEYARLLAVPDIKAMHHACCAHYVARLCTVTGADPERDSRFAFHRALAGTQFP